MLGGLLLMSDNAAPQPSTSAEEAFEHLTALVGRWTAEVRGRHISVDIRLTAGGSALVETWTLSPGRESLTIYTRDADHLHSVHYCPQGNQPRLRFAGVDSEQRYRFAFLDGSNLQDPRAQHQHTSWTRIDGANQFTRGERYRPNRVAEEGPEPSEYLYVFQRVEAERRTPSPTTDSMP